MNPLKQLLTANTEIKEIDRIRRELKERRERFLADVAQAKADLIGFCPMSIGDSVPLDTGGYGEVIGIKLLGRRSDYVSYGVTLLKDDEEHFMKMVPSRANMGKLRY